MLIGAESIATESNELIGLLRLFSLSSHQVGVGKRPMSERKKRKRRKFRSSSLPERVVLCHGR